MVSSSAHTTLAKLEEQLPHLSSLNIISNYALPSWSYSRKFMTFLRADGMQLLWLLLNDHF